MMEKPTVYGPQAKAEQAKQVKGRWWDQPKEQVHNHVFAEVKRLKAHYKTRHNTMSAFRRLYEEGDSSIYSKVLKQQNTRQFMHSRLIFNVLKSCVDTASSKIARNKPRPVYLSDKDSWEYGRRARNMTKFMEGMFQQVSGGHGDEKTLYGVARRVFVGAAVQGIDGIKFYRDGDNVCAEKAMIENILVDPLEAMFGYHRNLHETYQVPREIVLDLYADTPAKKRFIEMVGRSAVEEVTKFTDATDFIDVVESYHLGTGEDGKPGRKTVSIANATLTDEPYKRSYFPFLFYRWTPALRGWFGIGLGEEIFGIQHEMNKILYDIQRAQHLVARPQVWLEYKAGIVQQHMTNEIGGIRYYHGTPPVFATPQAMSPEVYQHFENLYRKAYELTGISLLAATSQKPAGLNSGVALREYSDIQTERFALLEQRYEEMFMDACQIIEDLCDDIAEDGGNPMSKIKAGKYLEQLKWKDVKLPQDRRIVRPHPANILPSEPAGKLEKVQELLQAGFFDKDEAMDLLDYPDLGKIRRLQTADRNIVMQMIEQMVDSGEYLPPEPYMNLEKARSIAQSYYLEYKLQGCPEDKLMLVQQFMDDIQSLLVPDEPGEIQQAMPMGGGAPDAGMPPAPGMPPMMEDPGALQTGVPAAPPVSDLLPTGA
jgi:hypothetical protein